MSASGISNRDALWPSGRVRLIGTAILMSLAIGCRSETTQPGDQDSGHRSSTATNRDDVPRFSVDQLGSPLASYLPPLDGGRIEVAPPVGWHVEPRDQSYVTRFVLDRTRRTMLPRITVTAEDMPFDELGELDAGNLTEFRDQVAQQFTDARQRALLEAPRCMILGDVPCVRYVINKKFRRGERVVSAESQVIQASHQGRIYTVLLDVFAGKLLDYRNDAYAVAAGLVFHDVEVQPEAESETDDVQPRAPEEDEHSPDPEDDDEKDDDEEIDPFG